MPLPTSAFADEAGPSLDEQIQALVDNQIGGIDVRSLEGKNVLDLSDAQYQELKRRATDAGLRVQCVGSPVNKVTHTDGYPAQELAKFEKAVHAAHQMGTRAIRIFTPEINDVPLAEATEIAVRWLQPMIDLATREDLIILHENDAKFFGYRPEQTRALADTLAGPHFQFAFDFSNAVLEGFPANDDWFPMLTPHLHTLHIKDAIREPRAVVPAGEGEGNIVPTLRQLLAAGWSGPLTLEPHLAHAGRFGGFSGREKFDLAAQAMRKVAEEAGTSLV